MAQGNIFIRELLRTKRLPIGTKKEDFENNLLEAIEAGKLQLDEIQNWLDEVEGWGNQHIYLYHCPETTASDPLWQSVDAIKKRIPAQDRALWDATSLVFPESWTLTSISYDNESLNYVWHRRLTTLLRKPKMDRRERIDGDWYQFRAHLERPDRAVMRFVLHLRLRIAAVFMQIPVEGDAHDEALDWIRQATKTMLDWNVLLPISTSDIIKNLDQAALENQKSKVRSQKTRLMDADNYIEFANTSEGGEYRQSEAVRAVRRAVKPRSFAGSSGVFWYKTTTSTQLERSVKIEISGENHRLKLWAQMKANEVWEILVLLRNSE
jgi:hypothetical protein